MPTSCDIITAVWNTGSCQSPTRPLQPCDTAFVAGWVGSIITAATLAWDRADSAWGLMGQFDLDPSYGTRGNHQCWSTLAFVSAGLAHGRGCTTSQVKRESGSILPLRRLCRWGTKAPRLRCCLVMAPRT